MLYLRFYELRFPSVFKDTPNPILFMIQCCQRCKLPSRLFFLSKYAAVKPFLEF